MNDVSITTENLFLTATGEAQIPPNRRHLFGIFIKLSNERREAMLKWAQRQTKPQAISYVRMFALALAEKKIDLSQAADWRPLLADFIESQRANIKEPALSVCRADIIGFLSSWFDIDQARRPATPVITASRLQS